jgi:prevent-host-death family protein
MTVYGIRAIQQNASAVVAEVVGGTPVTITDRGRPVVRMVPVRPSRLEELIEAGLATPARGSLADLPPPDPRPTGAPSLTEALLAMREDERY